MNNQDLLRELTQSHLKSIILEVLSDLDPDFDPATTFGDLGLNSFNVLKIIKALERDFGPLAKTILFQYFTVSDLAQYFITDHEHTLIEKFSNQLRNGASANNAAPAADVAVNDVGDVVAARAEPILIGERDAHAHPELGPIVGALFERYKGEGSVSRGTRIIAPNLFIGSERRGYINFNRRKDILLTYAYVGPEDYYLTLVQEMYRYCAAHKCRLNMLADGVIESVGGVPFTSTPFGALQRVTHLKDFTLEGGDMRRLRYQVTKFGKSGVCRTQEYRSGTRPDIDAAIVHIIDQWCATRTVVNPLVGIVREEIRAGALNPHHRLFLTFVDEVLQNAILIAEMSSAHNGYLMDLEFYPPDMPQGGLEFAIVKIIETLVAEGRDLLSLGGTYGCRLTTSANADPEVVKILDSLQQQNIFNDLGNLQFKNKFRPQNQTIYLNRPVPGSNANDVIDVIMMIAEPPPVEPANANKAAPPTQPSKQPIKQPAISVAEVSNLAAAKASEIPASLRNDARATVLAESGFNPLNIPHGQIDFDLATDSWAQLRMPSIDGRMNHLHSQLQQPSSAQDGLSAIFPFKYLLLTTSGRMAEHLFCKAWPKKGVVLQNLLFPTGIFHQIDNGFTPREVPHREVFQLSSGEIFKGNLAWDALQAEITRDAGRIAFVCVELSNNASGGCPVSMRHLRELKSLLATHSIALVLDATRVIENARFIIEAEVEFAGRDVWDVVRELLSLADVVIGSLPKDFCVDRGGLVATNDADLYRRLQQLQEQEGALDVIDRKLIALSLQNRKFIDTQVALRMASVRSICNALKAHGVPVVEPSGGHCVLIDVKRIGELAQFEYPVASFLAWLYLSTGIRAGAHSVGMQRHTSLDDLVRLAIPVGLKAEQVEEIVARLIRAFEHKVDIPELVIASASQGIGDVHAKYELKQYHAIANGAAAGGSESEQRAATIAVPVAADVTPVAPPVVNREAPAAPARQPASEPIRAQEIAIVGLAGRYPKAKNLDELWDNLRRGRDCIEEIPASRHDLRRRYATTEKYRGGFIDDVDKFDSLFFNISPKEAEMLDPQERLFLEVAWEAIEDAGYYPEILSLDDAPRNIGVFVGAVWAMYQMLGVEERHAGNQVVPNSFLWSIANRVSYWMNLTGPSLALDTACSSSLTALYLACEALRAGECSAALVGGVNLDLHQSKYDINWAGGALSKDGVCRSFGQGANGYVAGEGVGALFLKPLDRAIQDRDHIYGVIKSVVVNHGGRTSGYTVPNPKAHTELILAALDKGNVDARSIGYVEAHGTGTALGDPVEITGLSDAFGKHGVRTQSCAIGSIKTNIGHLEAAAGVVSISKVLLQMQHAQLVPSLHSTELNEFIDFPNSPFYVEQTLEPWREKEVDGASVPRRAAISSFGAGGSNVHVILEQHSAVIASTADVRERMFVISARNEDQLRSMAARLRAHVERISSGSDAQESQQLANIAYTLQAGRKSFECRAAVVARTKQELLDGLARVADGRGGERVWIGHAKNAQTLTRLFDREEQQELIHLLTQRRDPRKLAQLWVEGLLADLHGFQSEPAARRVSLPTYPFADRRHWVGAGAPARDAGEQRLAAIHPLIDANESTFERQLFRKTFHDGDFFIHDHSVADLPTLPGVAYLEMARKAAELAAGVKVRKIRNMLWVSPITVARSKPKRAVIELKPSGDWVQFEVFSDDDGARVLHAQGKLSYAADAQGATEPEYIDLDAIRSRSTRVSDATQAYPLFRSMGLDLGPSFQVLRELYTNENETLGLLQLSEPRRAELQSMLLHPALVDGSLQAGVAAQLRQATGEMLVPYTIGEVEILHPLPATCFSYVTESKEHKKESRVVKRDVLIVDEHGQILVKIRDCVGVPLRDVNKQPEQASPTDSFATLFYSHDWEKLALELPESGRDSVGSVLFFCRDDALAVALQERLRKVGDAASRVIHVRPADEYAEIGAGGQQTPRYQLNPRSPEDFELLLMTLERNNESIDSICFSWSAPSAYAGGSHNDAELLRQALESGVYAFLFLCQALIRRKLEGKVRLLYLSVGEPEARHSHDEAMIGFTKTLQLEHPKLACKMLEIRQDQPETGQVVDALWAELHPVTRDSLIVRYEDASRYVRKLKAIDAGQLGPAQPLSLTRRGAYLITGGAGGLGLIFAEHLASECGATVVLVGRGGLTPEKTARLDELRQCGAQITYLSADVSKRDQVMDLVTQIRSQFGEINGIIHCAGVLRDSYIRNKTAAELDAVFAPKIYGTLHLDELTQSDPLDFFVMFSSLAAVAGNAGQADYSFANSFMDSFAQHREAQRAQGRRAGRTLSLNWSLWADGGMQLDGQTEAFFRKTLGIKPLSTAIGLAAFAQGLASGRSQLAVLEGVQEKVELAWGLRKRETPAPVAAAARSDESSANSASSELDQQLVALVSAELTHIAMDLLKLEAADISDEQILLDLGFDSIGLTTYANAINDKYQLDITPVLFFDYPSIGALAPHLCTDRRSEVLRFHRAGTAPATSQQMQVPPADTRSDENVRVSEFAIGNAKGWNPRSLVEAGSNVQPSSARVSSQNRFVDMPIAIVGMSGVMPQSDDLQEFWNNLQNERDMITVVPGERWRWQDFDGDPLKQANKTNSRWGGFMRQVDRFDPLFFGISPREAQMMDPQQRIFLETVWKAVEDSGHKVSDLAGTRTGLFVGVATNDYIDLMNSRRIDLDGYSASGNSHSVLANRVSFLLNLRGPSAPIDTACSSSLIALHRAVESIHTGSSEMAIVGGVQVMLTPAAYISFSMAGMLSGDGKCKTFDKRANGYVRGEGCGAILLKPLAKAEADGNHIYAVIRATAENHGGRVTTLTAPNASAQAELLIEAYGKAQIDPTTVGYIECHGTGTPLGDPIEIQALKTAFSDLYRKQGKAPPAAPHCGLSAVKTNIGHLETAAGIAGILKVLLAIQHQQIPASLHFEEVNPYIDLKGSPFHIVSKTTPWPAPGAHDGSVLPRRAGVSSFGFGGANAHIVLEEYIPQRRHAVASVRGPQVIVLSAKHEDRLKAYAQAMLDYLDRREVELVDLAYTLQVGRDAMPERLAFVAASVAEVKSKLAAFLANPSSVAGVYRKSVAKGKEKARGRGVSEAELRSLIDSGQLLQVAELWASGDAIDWSLLRQDGAGRRISIPTYPFAKERCWIPTEQANKGNSSALSQQGASHLHPLIHANASTLQEQKFVSHFSGQEFFLADHIVKSQKILPGVAYMEMARVAGGLAAEREIRCIRNLIWERPLVVGNEAKQVETLLAPATNGVKFTIRSAAAAGFITHCTGELPYSPQMSEPDVLDIHGILQRCPEQVITGAQLYPFLSDGGLMLGKSFQIVERILANRSESLAILRLPEHLEAEAQQFLLHPALMDGSLHTAIGLMKQNGMDIPLSVPYSVEEVQVLHSLKDLRYGYATWENVAGNRADPPTATFHLLDSEGRVLVRIKRLASRAFHGNATQKSGAGIRTAWYRNVWQPSQRRSQREAPPSVGCVLLLDKSDDVGAELRRRFERANVVSPRIVSVRVGAAFRAVHADLYEIDPADATHYPLVARALQSEGALPDTVVHMWSEMDFDTARDDSMPRLMIGVCSLLHLTQALSQARQDPSGGGQRRPGNTKLLCIYPNHPDNLQPQHAALGAFLKTVSIDDARFVTRAIELQARSAASAASATEIVDGLWAELQEERTPGAMVRYSGGECFSRSVEELELPASGTTLLKERGVYLITGGARGLGLLFAKFLAGQTRARLILTGRSALTSRQKEQLAEIESLGAQVHFYQADVADRAGTERLIEDVKTRFGRIDGVLHSAGVLRDAAIRNKTIAEIEAVCAPKIAGAINLDAATRTLELDFFVVFSSLTAITGNAGQSDYAYANSFMDHFVELRERLAQRGERSGKTLCLNWSLWKEGGMPADERVEALLKEKLGIHTLDTQVGLETFARGLASSESQILVMHGNPSMMSQMFGSAPARAMVAPSTANEAAKGSSRGARDWRNQLTDELLGMVTKVLLIAADKFSRDTDMSEYGLDSVSLISFFGEINARYSLDLTPAIFFEYPSFNALCDFLCSDYAQQLEAYFRPQGSPAEAQSRPASDLSIPLQPAEIREVSPAVPSVAIVGMSGVFPGSENLDEFWDNLAAEKDLITEIPADRWDWKAYAGNPFEERNKTNSRWGGFMKEVDKFDTLFFGITPLEAELMDPQKRIFLETAWKAIEDSGHRPSELAGTRTGVFVGVAGYDYVQLLLDSKVDVVAYTATGMSHSVLPNRISYLLDLHGPSEPVDTACSSSLIAIHRAVEAIANGSCEMAIAGGVNVILSPSLYVAFGNAGMLSNDGRCKTFDKRADGYVRGEGCGAVFLKRLDRAIADGDPIYAVIKGSGVNHGGHATSLTAPNPNAQAELLLDVYQRAGVDPDRVSYIEAHGTGTPLGDPVELNGLKKAFRELYRSRNQVPGGKAFCAVGSVKTNIGHLETAAGIASVIKVLLALEHKQIPGTVHYQEPNPHIRLDGSPFYIAERTQQWRTSTDQTGRDLPRVAGVSSFGFGGANCHLVLEEYPEPAVEVSADDAGGTFVVPLSARTAAQLRQKASDLLEFIRRRDQSMPPRPIDIAAMAYTLQVGRDAMAERLGFVVSSIRQLAGKLAAYIDGERNIEGCFGADMHGPDAIGAANDKEPAGLLRLWVGGHDVDWRQLYGEALPRRISLPTYPFARERYWAVPESAERIEQARTAAPALHPLLHVNTSNFSEQRYFSVFTGEEFFVSTEADRQILSAAACLEMARAAAQLAVPGSRGSLIWEIHNAEWSRPIDITLDRKVSIVLSESAPACLDFEICGASHDGEEEVCCQGTAISGQHAPAHVDIEQLQAQMTIAAPTALDGEAHAQVKALYKSERQLLVHMTTPEALADTRETYGLHPCLLDCAIRAAVTLVSGATRSGVDAEHPVGLQLLRVASACTSEMYAWIRFCRGSHPEDRTCRVDIDMTDRDGLACVTLRSLTFAMVREEPELRAQQRRFEALLDALDEGYPNVVTTSATGPAAHDFERLLDEIY